MTPSPRTSVTYELSGVDETDSQVTIIPKPEDDAKGLHDRVQYAPTFVFSQADNDVTAKQTSKAQPEDSATDKQTSKVQSEDSATDKQTSKVQSEDSAKVNPPPPAPPAGAQQGAGSGSTGASLFLKTVDNLLDKLTDVLNFGRILSIGLPGFVAAFGLLMLLSLLSPMPTKCVVMSGTTSDTAASMKSAGAPKPTDTTKTTTTASDSAAVRATTAAKGSADAKAVAAVKGSATAKAVTAVMESVASKAGAPAKAATANSSGKQEASSPLYYEQNHSVRLLNDIDRIRVQFDSFRIVSKWYFLLLWLIGAIITGSLISQWGYSNLRNRGSLFGLWNEIIRSVKEFILKSGKPEEDAEVMTAALKAASVMFAKPRGWRGLRGTLERLHRDNPKWSDYYELLVRLQRARDSCSDEPSWSMLHLPLLGQNMVASPAISYYDYLTKEYWRFAEFAINCPTAVWIFCLTMGLYFCSLSVMYSSHAWIVGSILVGLALVVYLIAYFWWNPNVAFTSFQLYVQARSGLITGLSLFPAKDPAVTNPMIQKMYTDCPDFRTWYCKSYRAKLGLAPKEKCDAAYCTVATTTSAPVTPTAKTEAEAQPGPAAPCSPQAQVNVQVGAPFQVSVSIQSRGDADKKPS